MGHLVRWSPEAVQSRAEEWSIQPESGSLRAEAAIGLPQARNLSVKSVQPRDRRAKAGDGEWMLCPWPRTRECRSWGRENSFGRTAAASAGNDMVGGGAELEDRGVGFDGGGERFSTGTERNGEGGGER